MRHRWLLGTFAVVGLLAGASASPASAVAPTKVGWWNLAPAGSTAVGADAPAGGIRVAVASQRTTAFGAVAFPLVSGASATLTLTIAQSTSSSSQPVTEIAACPTKDDSWKTGDAQDASTAPAYDCDAKEYDGQLTQAGDGYSFILSGLTPGPDGLVSVAIVPLHTTKVPVAGVDTGQDVTAPAVTDFAKPTDSALVVTGGAGSSASSDFAPGGGWTSPTSTTTGAGQPSLQAPAPPIGALASAPAQQPVLAQQPPLRTIINARASRAVAASRSIVSSKLSRVLLVLAAMTTFAVMYARRQTHVVSPVALAATEIFPSAAGGGLAGSLPGPVMERTTRVVGELVQQHRHPRS